MSESEFFSEVFEDRLGECSDGSLAACRSRTAAAIADAGVWPRLYIDTSGELRGLGLGAGVFSDSPEGLLVCVPALEDTSVSEAGVVGTSRVNRS